MKSTRNWSDGTVGRENSIKNKHRSRRRGEPFSCFFVEENKTGNLRKKLPDKAKSFLHFLRFVL